MAAISVRELVDAGVHFGHHASRWNPKMSQFIHGKRNLIHIINLVETVKGLTRARHFLKELASTGRQIVIVGTKRQIKSTIATEAQRAGMPYVNERWLGGTLTNFTTIRSRLKRLEELEQLELSGDLLLYTKKEQAMVMRELKRIKKNLDGVRVLNKLPGALVVIDPAKEYIAVREANRLRVPIVSVLDTDCDPDLVDIPIPANDDAMRSVSLILSKLVDAIVEGRANYREGVAAIQDDEPQIEMKRRENRGPQRRQGGPKKGGRGEGRGEGRGPSAPAADEAPEAAAESAPAADAGETKA
ncbi:MAG: 30S ribosomal protein S2 [Planctomycetes bacterium]|nr:30S ribosomal protein S2 [Planctomycetota bacterium]MCC7172300.1 30S ribosomal protein S2 [Planctomycetota bacterium]